MPISLLMPALSPTMTEGTLVKWLKKEGEAVKAGNVIAEIETDKATMEVEAVDEGILGRILVAAGTEKVAVNAVIALLLEEGEDSAVLDKEAETLSQTKAQNFADPPSQAEAQVLKTAAPTPVKDATSPPQQAANGGRERRIFASPLARRLAAHGSFDLSSLSGSGPHGRIVKRDVENAAKLSPPAATLPYGQAGYVDLPLNIIRKITAKRLTESKQQVPHFYLTIDCALDALLDLRADLNARLEEEKLSVNDFILRAAALALIQTPEANASWQDAFLRRYQSADIAVAVAVKDGLMTPIIRAAEQKTLRQISSEMKALAEKARLGKLTPEEFQGGTFTISNLGMYGVKRFSAIINPPQACILAIGMGEQRPIIRQGQIEVSTQMTCTLSVDHRAVDGAVGAGFLAAFKGFMEDPLKLII